MQINSLEKNAHLLANIPLNYPFMPTVPTFAVRETNVYRHNGGTSGAPLKPLRDDSALRALENAHLLANIVGEQKLLDARGDILRVQVLRERGHFVHRGHQGAGGAHVGGHLKKLKS